MSILYIFPHPDDESFGPAPVMAKQISEGKSVFLLTLTKGEATKERFKLGLSKEEMGSVRANELEKVAQVLGLTGLTICDFPDGGLKNLDPRVLEQTITDAIKRLQPTVIVTYNIFGISGHHDHLTTHAAVKRAFVELKSTGEGYLKRLAFYTMPERKGKRSISFSKEEEIDCIVKCGEAEMEKVMQALDCYASYRDRIEKTGVKKYKSNEVYFEFFQESFAPPLSDLNARLR